MNTKNIENLIKYNGKHAVIIRLRRAIYQKKELLSKFGKDMQKGMKAREQLKLMEYKKALKDLCQ